MAKNNKLRNYINAYFKTAPFVFLLLVLESGIIGLQKPDFLKHFVIGLASKVHIVAIANVVVAFIYYHIKKNSK